MVGPCRVDIAVLLLHGLTFDRSMWQPTLEHLRRIDPGRRILSLDLPGHGESTGHWCYDGEAVGTAVHVLAAGLHSPSVAPQLRGPGFPAVWEMFVASMHFELLPLEAQDLLRATCRPTQDLVLGYWGITDGPTKDFTEVLEAELSALRSASVPYHVVAGHEPEPGYREWLAEALPQATISVWPDSGHFPQLAHPDQFAECLKATTDWSSPDGKPSPVRGQPA